MEKNNNKKFISPGFDSNFKKENNFVYRLKGNYFDFKSTIDSLEKIAKKNKIKNLRICLHEFDGSLVQHMIIYHSSKYKVPIHRHRYKSEFLKIHKGHCFYKEYFEQNGEFVLKKKVNLNVDDVIIVPTNIWHNIEIEEDIIFTEVSEGPFNSLSTDFAKK